MTLEITSILCKILILNFAGSPLIYSPRPRGSCSDCCPLIEVDDVKFMLYTRQNPTVPHQLFLSDSHYLNESHFDENQKLILFIHGFSETVSGNTGHSSQGIRDAFLESDNYNVILVDWSSISTFPWYSKAVENLPKIGRYIAKFILFLIENAKIKVDRIHVIGFSLGAEVAGFIGNQMKEWDIVLPRITALDPPGPLFSKGSKNHQLTTYSAKFVDVIHTDALLGNFIRMGHVDFYPNRDLPLQPGCISQGVYEQNLVKAAFGCSHQRAWEYFVESIRWPKSFRSKFCKPIKTFQDSCRKDVRAYMGLSADKRLRGKYYLRTNLKSPFGNNRFFIL